MAKRKPQPRRTRPPRKTPGAGPGGRPSKFTPERQKKILDAARAGNYLETCAAFAGIHYDTLNEWIKRGDDVANRLPADEGLIAEALSKIDPLDQEFFEFSEALRVEAAVAEVAVVAKVRSAALDDWRAGLPFLMKRYQDRWGRQVQQRELSGPGGKPIQVEDTTAPISDAERLQRIQKLLGATG